MIRKLLGWVAQTLAWVLSSTIRKLRDQATKAMVNLLEEQPDTLIQTFHAFKYVDDPYITERLYAVAYGCILRTSSLYAVQIIAQHVYNEVFSQGCPPHHVLLRDYARNTVEYGLYRKADIAVDPLLIRPKLTFIPGKSRQVHYTKEHQIITVTNKAIWININ